MLELSHATKLYDNGILAVDALSLGVGASELVVIVGPSGCGKSTTLRLVAGLESLTFGDISIDGKVITDMPPKDRDVAMVFQSYALYPHMTVRGNMSFGLKVRKTPKDEIEYIVQETAAILGIEDLLDRKPKTLSGGQQQRVGLGRAMVRKPRVFLLDEPLSNLDAMLRVEMRAEVLDLHQRLAKTMLYVTHDMVEAMTMGDRVVVMRDGVIEQVDTPEALYDSPATDFVSDFVRRETMESQWRK